MGLADSPGERLLHKSQDLLNSQHPGKSQMPVCPKKSQESYRDMGAGWRQEPPGKLSQVS